jgi:hypothetical protein
MSIARFNFSHGSHDYHWETLQNLRTACERGGHTCGVLLDTKGPEVRTGRLRGGGPVTYTEGSQVTVTTNYDAEGDETTIALSLRSLAAHVRPGTCPPTLAGPSTDTTCRLPNIPHPSVLRSSSNMEPTCPCLRARDEPISPSPLPFPSRVSVCGLRAHGG